MLVPVVLGFVALGLVDPDIAGAVDVPVAHCRDLARPHSDQSLQLAHRADRPGHVGQHGGDVFRRHGLNGIGLTDSIAALHQARHGYQSLIELRRDQFVLGCSLECPADLRYAEVDGRARQAGIDPRPADGFQGKGTEPGGECVAVQISDRTKRVSDVIQFTRRMAVAAVMRLRENPVAKNQLANRER